MERVNRAERGQALVLVVVIMIGLLAVVGLAVDGGTAFLERRRMQNAADAAALSGTRELTKGICGNPGADDGAIYQDIIDYAEKNGVDLIAMSTHGASGPTRWAMGSVTQKVMSQAGVPLLTVTPSSCRP